MTKFYQRPINELIQTRYSCRNYFKKKIEYTKLIELKETCSTFKKGLTGEKVTFQFIELSDDDLRKMKLADFSYIIHPMSFITCSIQKSELAYESCGYLFEHIILKATDLSLGTCWLGYFNPGFFREVKLADDEILPAVCVVGYAAERGYPSMRTRWENIFFEEDFDTPISRESAGRYWESLEMVRLAPSSGNTQPWRIIKERKKNTFHFYKKVIDRSYERKRLHNIDLGIAMCHFELASKKNNLEGKWEKKEQNIRWIPGRTEYILSWIEKS